jgi:hypothetical protein
MVPLRPGRLAARGSPAGFRPAPLPLALPLALLAQLTLGWPGPPVVLGAQDAPASEGAPVTAEDGATPGAVAGPGGAVLSVRLEDYRVGLPGEAVPPGPLRLLVLNAGQRVHNLRLQSPEVEAQTADVLPGEGATLKVTLTRPGTYAFFCDVAYHQQKGMVAVLTVAPDATLAPTRAPLAPTAPPAGHAPQASPEAL